jgi:hypothetical protein
MFFQLAAFSRATAIGCEYLPILFQNKSRSISLKHGRKEVKE